MLSESVQLAIAEADDLRKMLNYIADRKRFENTQRVVKNIIAESVKRHEALILAYINRTNDIHGFLELAGKNMHGSKIRQILQKTDVQCNEIIQQLDLMLKYIDAKLMQTNCVKVSAMSNYVNMLLNLQQSLNQCEIHKKNRKSANMVRKIRICINSLVEKINNVEKKMPENVANVVNEIVSSEVDDEEDYDFSSVFDDNC